MLDWFNSRDAAQIGAALADEFAPPGSPANTPGSSSGSKSIERLLMRADSEVRLLRLNFFKKAKFANSFKWRLIENGVARETADDVTQSLVMHLSQVKPASLPDRGSKLPPPERSSSATRKQLLTQGNQAFAKGAFSEAVANYQDLLELDPRNAEALHNLGSALTRLGLLSDAEEYVRRAIKCRPDFAEAHCTLGIVLRARGENAESEIWLRRALKLKPNYLEARIHHGVSLLALGRLREASARFAKVLKSNPRHADAFFLTGQIALLEGRFDEAEGHFNHALEINPKMPNALAALAQTRKMTSSDAGWLTRAQQIAEEGGIAPLEEAALRFSMGKYCDDVKDFGQAFANFKRGNELVKSGAEAYDRVERTSFVDDMIHIYTRAAIATVQAGVSASDVPVFVVGMPRSGTSLIEQIVASHPSAKGVGELGFIDDKMLGRGSDLRRGLLGEPLRRNLAETYLRALEARSGGAARIVDKAPVNSDYLGPIYSVFPNARIIYMRRDPIDTCLSCYFQQFLATQDYTMDLSDLAHHYREHRRLMAHWRAVLPSGSILDVPYAELVADQEKWTRKILEFLELDWDARCLEFHKTERPVVTASYWQVRQKIYKNSVARWRNYKKFIKPLLSLKE
jgi:tetratricopeptide (TPR) repeat protein